jgi:hypothetical protein
MGGPEDQGVSGRRFPPRNRKERVIKRPFPASIAEIIVMEKTLD